MDAKEISPQVARELIHRVTQQTRKIVQSDEFIIYSFISLALGFPVLSLVLFLATCGSTVGLTVGGILMVLNLLLSALLGSSGKDYFYVLPLVVGAFIFLVWFCVSGAWYWTVLVGGTISSGRMIWDLFNSD